MKFQFSAAKNDILYEFEKNWASLYIRLAQEKKNQPVVEIATTYTDLVVNLLNAHPTVVDAHPGMYQTMQMVDVFDIVSHTNRFPILHYLHANLCKIAKHRPFKVTLVCHRGTIRPFSIRQFCAVARTSGATGITLRPGDESLTQDELSQIRSIVDASNGTVQYMDVPST